jgi:hypothetical protein
VRVSLSLGQITATFGAHRADDRRGLSYGRRASAIGCALLGIASCSSPRLISRCVDYVNRGDLGTPRTRDYGLEDPCTMQLSYGASDAFVAKLGAFFYVPTHEVRARQMVSQRQRMIGDSSWPTVTRIVTRSTGMHPASFVSH